MKKMITITTAITMMCSFLTAMGITASASYAGDNEMVEYDASPYIEANYDGEAPDLTNAEITPTLSVVSQDVTLDKNIVTVEFMINGADQKYDTTQLHVMFDGRLQLAKESKPCKKGSAIADSVSFGSSLDIYVPGQYGQFLVYTTGDGSEQCSDGVLFTADFILPDDAKTGDVYPIGYVYINDDVTNDVFTCVNDPENGQMMQDWIFTNGIQNGYIKVVENPNTEIKNADEFIENKLNGVTEEKKDEFKSIFNESVNANEGITVDVNSKHMEENVETKIDYTFMFCPVNLPKNAKVYWFCDNSSVATVESGMVHVIGYGKATIFAVVGNCTMSCTIDIANPDPVGDANEDNESNMADVVAAAQALNNPEKYGVEGTSENHITAKGMQNANLTGGNGLTDKDVDLMINNITKAA